ncbi:MAG: glycosyltransferase [Salinivirgaceae bacterium]|nr:glycosyltransferase [Salinivirgaceae bacterium]
MKHIAVLLNGPIASDSRVIREIKTMSRIANIDLFYTNGNETDNCIFENNVRLFNCIKEENLRSKFIRHTCFYNEFMFFVPKVLEQGIAYDYIWANDLPDLKPALKIKKVIGSKVIYDSHEIYIGTLNQFFPSKAKFYKSLLHKTALFLMTALGHMAEKKMVKQIDEFVTTSVSFKNYFQQKYNLSDIKIVMNCPRTQTDTDFFDFRKECDLPADSFIILFQGRLNAGRALMEMIEAQQYVKPNIHLFVLGDGPLKKDMINFCNKLSLQNVHFIDEVPSSELLHYTRGANAGINLQASINISKHLASANKLFEYTHSGIPTIGSDVPENKLIIEKYDLGLLVKNEPQEIASAINKMSVMDLSRYKANCQKATQEYNWEKQENMILQIIK